MKRFGEAAERIKGFLSRYKYPALILLAGLFLVLLPGKKNKESSSAVIPARTEETAESFSAQSYCLQTERDLEQILSLIDGAGKVQVMLTLQAGEETVFLSETTAQKTEDGGKTSESLSEKTVILSRGASYNEAAIVKTKYPVFRGALIVSQGGDDPVVRLRLVEAVSALLGIGSDKITVVKMK